MRVIYYCHSFSQLSETAIYTWIDELNRQGVDGHVMTHLRFNESERPFQNVHVVPHPAVTDPDRIWWWGREKLRRATARTSWLTTIRSRMEKVLRRIRPDVIHAHFGNDAWTVVPAARAVGVPLIVTFHGYDISELVKHESWRRRYQEDLWPAISYATVLSEEMREAVAREGCPPEKIRIVRVGRRFRDMPQPAPNVGHPFTVVSIGRLSEKKGFADAIDAIGLLVSEGRRLRLQIFGEGKLQGELERRIADRGLGDSVHLAGAHPNNKVLDTLRKANAFLLCSKTASNGDREGTPNVLVEAQALGLPCVSTRHAGIPEMIPFQNHELLADEGDVQGLSHRLARVMDMTPEERVAVGALGRDKVYNEYNLEAESRKFRKLYTTIAAQASTGV